MEHCTSNGEEVILIGYIIIPFPDNQVITVIPDGFGVVVITVVVLLGVVVVVESEFYFINVKYNEMVKCDETLENNNYMLLWTTVNKIIFFLKSVKNFSMTQKLKIN